MEFDQTSTDTLLGSGKKWLDFGDLYLVFKVTPALWNSNFDRKKSLCAHYILNQWLEFYQTSTDTSLGHEKKVIRFGDLDLIFKVTTL